MWRPIREARPTALTRNPGYTPECLPDSFIEAPLNGIPRMKTYTAVIERDAETALYVGYVPGFPGAHSQGATLDELQQNLAEVITMLLEDGEPRLDGEFVGTQTVLVA